MGDLAAGTTFDAGLRKHMLSIYNYMASAVLLTGVVAMLTARSGFVYSIMGGGLLTWVIMLSPLAIVVAMSFGRDRFSTATLQAMFWGFAVLMGLSLSTIFVAAAPDGTRVYSDSAIAMAFFSASASFAGLSLFGYTTQKNLSGLGSFLIMGVIGLIIASLLNAFLIGSPGLELAISALGVLIFAGLTAYDTQRLKHEYLAIQQIRMTNPSVAAAYPLGKLVIMGALNLYLDFINMFLYLLRLFASRD
jgi:hypothetical protein